MDKNKIKIEVAYANAGEQCIIALEVLSKTTIEKAIQQSNMLVLFPEIDLTKQAVGIFSSIKKLSDQVLAGDRIEIYRPLLMDPKEVRRLRNKHKMQNSGRSSSYL
jgi:putative ubiquitin-RnfH superfamily antitoxin RatB of RatAB toxin-antitoxin module